MFTVELKLLCLANISVFLGDAYYVCSVVIFVRLFRCLEIYLRKLINLDPGGAFLTKGPLKSALHCPFRSPFGGP